MLCRLLIATVFVFQSLAFPAMAQEKSAVKQGFSFPGEASATILVFRPDISVGEQSTAGLNEPNSEWTETARQLLTEELVASDITKKHNFRFLPEYDGEQGKLVADYQGLFDALAASVMTHQLFRGNRLPTKKNSDSLEYTMGSGAQQLAELGGGEYGLFFFTHDSYGSGGRKALQAAGMLGCLIGACVIVPSGVHIGYAGLVDLKTGDLVWINADGSMGGDVREAEGAAKRVRQLLEGFPETTYAGPVSEPKFITTEVQVGDAEPTTNTEVKQPQVGAEDVTDTPSAPAAAEISAADDAGADTAAATEPEVEAEAQTETSL